MNKKQSFSSLDDYNKYVNDPTNISKLGHNEYIRQVKNLKKENRKIRFKHLLRMLPHTFLLFIPWGIGLFLLDCIWLSKYDFMANIPSSIVLFIGFILFVIIIEIKYNYLKK